MDGRSYVRFGEFRQSWPVHHRGIVPAGSSGDMTDAPDDEMPNLPDPPVSAECDLRDFEFMPLSVLRLRDSTFASLKNAEAFRCGVLLWAAAWHQVPSASLPNEEATLARLAGYGRDLKAFRNARDEGALRGFYLCRDGRLYHPVIAEKAVVAWKGKLAQRERTAAARAAKAAKVEAARAAALAAEAGNASATTDSVTEPVTGQSQAPRERDRDSDRERDRDREILKDSSLRSGRAERAPNGGGEEIRNHLFGEGAGIVCRVTGKTPGSARSYIGALLRQASDDAAKVLDILRRCELARPADPTAWIGAAIADRKPLSKAEERRRRSRETMQAFLADDDAPTTIEHEAM